MATLDITDVRPDLRPNGNSFAEGRLNPPAELWAPPLAPNETTAVPNVLPREDTFHPAIGGEDFHPVIGGEDAFQPIALSNPSQTFLSRRNLIAGTAVIVAIGVAGLAYFFLASPAAKVPAETAESSATAVQSPEPSSPRVESSSATPVQPAPTDTVAEPSRGASGTVSSPDVAAALNPDVVFLQRPGVNIRSAPSGNAPVLGTAPRGTQFTASSREGDWVQVENTRLKGWINSQFLAPNKPQ
jgi:Bacterial SH3 domain